MIKFTNSASAQISVYGPISCKTDLYRPVVLTCKDDNTVGETIGGGNPTGYYGNGLRVCTSGQALSNLRVAFADKALTLDYAGGTLSLTNVQFVNCQTACQHEEATLQVRNGLIHRVRYVTGGYSVSFRGEHLTVHQCGRFLVDGELYLTNSLVSALTNGWGSGIVVTNQVVFSTSEIANLFTEVGAGYHYLAKDSPYRDCGTTNINSGLAAQLELTTTYPPVELSGLVTAPTRLYGRAWGDIDQPDLGYHYAPIDYAVCTLTVTNYGSLTLGPGLAVATYGDHGLRLENYGSLVAEGVPKAPVRLFRYNVVQEQPIDWGNTAYEPTILTGPCHDTLGGDAPPVASLRFVEFSGLGGYGNHLYTGNGWFLLKQLSLQDCTLWGGKAQFSGNSLSIIGLTNNLFVRTANKYYAWPQLSAYNNLFWGGSNRFERFSTAGTWVFRDNAFDGTGLTNVGAAIVNDYNAYIGPGQCQIGGNSISNVVLSWFPYVRGPLGEFYHYWTSLVDKGSRGADAAGLYHYTVRTNQLKETNSVVDIGFHYVAADEEGPLDTDDDGIADYLEDRNGNGVRDAGESDYQNPVSIDNCRLDGEIQAAPPELLFASYQCEAVLDYDTVPRNGELPDKKFLIEWETDKQSRAQQMAMFVECLPLDPPPETIVTNANDYNWPAWGPGLMTQWTQSLDGTKRIVLEQPSPRPPCSDSFLIPLEKSFNFTLPMQPPSYRPPFTGSYRRTASTVQTLYAGGLEWPKPKRSVVLQCLAIDKTSGDSLRLDSGGILWDEPDNHWIGEEIDPVVKAIKVYTERVNANGTVMIQLPVRFHNAWPAHITPGVSGLTWYMWELNFRAVCSTNRLTWSRHPNGPFANLQKIFDEGAMLLARDDDELVKDGDPRLNDPGFNQQDDAPTYIEFIVTKAKRSVFPPDFSGTNYNVIKDYEIMKA